jgi:hypothetical protein
MADKRSDAGARRGAAEGPRKAEALPVERVQVGARMEKRLVQVLKGLAEFKNMSMGQLLEEIALHSFEAAPGKEGQFCASPHSKRSLQAIADLKKVYGLDYDTHGPGRFDDKE